MLKTASFLTGDNYKMLAADTPASKKKVVAMAIAMLVPVMIWVFNGFMLSYQVVQSGWGWAIITAIACGLIVFFIEKLIIMANGNIWLTFFRVCIGLIVALLGSIAIDEVIFKDDINISVAAIKETTISDARNDEDKRFNVLNNIVDLDNNIVTAQAKYDNAVDITLAEADGTKGTKARGVGDIAKLKDQKANERKADLNSLHLKKENLVHTKDSLVTAAGIKSGRSFNEHALLTRIKALFHLVTKDGYMLSIYILFTLLMFFFEFLVVILKLTWKKTNYERKVEMIEEIGRNRMEYLMRKESPISDPGYFLPQLEDSRKALKNNISVFSQA